MNDIYLEENPPVEDTICFHNPIPIKYDHCLSGWCDGIATKEYQDYMFIHFYDEHRCFALWARKSDIEF